MTTFLDALTVPDLLKACVRSLVRKRVVKNQLTFVPGSGLKKLLCVSRGVRAVAQAAVRSCTLKLGDKPSRRSPVGPRNLSFLNNFQLLNLRIEIKGTGTEASPVKLATQLVAFITDAGLALRSVTHLHICLPPTIDSKPHQQAATHVSNTVLLPLAAACPQLQRLTVTGCVGSRFLKQCGISCPKLTCLEVVLKHLAIRTLQTLPKLLPQLSSLTSLKCPFAAYSSYPKLAKRQQRERLCNERICITLRACPNLLAVDVSSVKMTGDVWAAMPEKVTSLACSTLDDMPLTRGNLKAFTSLRSLAISGSGMGLSQLVTLLTAASKVNVLHVGTLFAVLSWSDAQDLQYLDARCSAGLMLFTQTQDDFKLPAVIGWQSGLRVSFTVTPYERTIQKHSTHHTYEHPLPHFMAAAIMGRPLLNVTEVELDNEEGEDEDEDDDESDDQSDEEDRLGRDVERQQLSHISRVFPNVQKLIVRSLKASEVGTLADCKALHTLTLDNVHGFSRSKLKALCKASTSLQTVHVIGCRSLSFDDVKWIELKRRVSGVRVKAWRGWRLDEEDKDAGLKGGNYQGNHHESNSWLENLQSSNDGESDGDLEFEKDEYNEDEYSDSDEDENSDSDEDENSDSDEDENSDSDEDEYSDSESE